jgi:type VI secretion system secreted protein VgrG
MAQQFKPMQMTLTSGAGDKLGFLSMSALEEVSRLFEYQIIAASDDLSLAPDSLLGKPVAVSIDLGGGAKRWFNGIVASFGIEGGDGRHATYRITARPWLWLLTRSADLRVFQDLSVIAIVKEIFAKYKGNVVDKTTGNHKPRGYCVQYRETDFNFVSRLLEEEGIFYWFAHTEDKHDLVLADDAGAHTVMPGYETTPYRVDQSNALAEQQVIFQWRMRHEIQSGKFSLRDYDFEKPSTDLLAHQMTSKRSHAEAQHEVYDYPGRYIDKAAGGDLATVRLDEAAAHYGRYTGETNTPGLAAGAKFTLKEHPRADQNDAYTVLATRIDMQQARYESGAEQDGGFLCSFTVQRFDEPFRPARSTRKPTVAGPQTAVVVGTGDPGDIFTDEYGRVKLQFHWDRLGKKDNTSSCWVRVASPWAGNGFGMISLPRLGQEVVVDFLEGDPDQPLVTGRVYNAAQVPPYALPDNASVSTVKSRSVKGATDAFNELRFEDKAGKEYVLFHAQKDRLDFIEETLKSQIGKDEHRSVKGNRKEKVEGEHHVSVTKDVKHKFDGKYNVTAGKDILFDGGGLFSLKAAKDITAESGASISLKSATAMHLKIGSNLGAEGGQNVHIKAGMNVVIEGGMQISIKAGGSSIVLGPDGVSITGMMVKINSGGSPGSGSGATPVAPTQPDAPEAPDLPVDPLTHR